MKTLAPALLVAMPDLMDPNFRGCVVLVTQHDATGSFGLVINRGTDLPVRVLCENLKMSWTGDQKERVKWGGPVFPEHGWVLVGDEKSDVMSLQNVSEGILFTRMFSTGSRTNRGLSGTLLSFPAVPRLKSIMQDGSVNQKFSSLASILKRRGYETYYLFGGDIN